MVHALAEQTITFDKHVVITLQIDCYAENLNFAVLFQREFSSRTRIFHVKLSTCSLKKGRIVHGLANNRLFVTDIRANFIKVLSKTGITSASIQDVNSINSYALWKEEMESRYLSLI